MTLARERQPGEQMEAAALFPPRRFAPRLEAQAPPGVTDIAPVRKTDPGPKFDWSWVVTQVHQNIEALL